MQPIETLQVVLRKEPYVCQLGRRGGGSIDVGLLSVNRQKINLIVGEDFLLNECVVPFCGSLLTLPR